MSNEDGFSNGQLKMALLVVGMFFLSLYFSITELRYAISGVNTQVQIYEVYQTSSSGRRRVPMVGAKFTLLPESDHPEDTAIEFPESWTPPADRKMWVTFIPGSSPIKVRLRGERNLVWPLIFLGMIGAVGFMGWRLWAEVSADTEQDRRSRNR